VPALAPGQRARCPRCRLTLGRHERLGASQMLAICLTAIVAFVLANVYPLVTLEVQGMAQQASLLGAIQVTWQQPGLWGVALMSLLTAFVLPMAQLLLLLALLLMLRCRRLPAGFAWATRALQWFRPWSMVPVFVLGVLVAVIKIAALAKIIIGVGLWAMAALVVLLTLLQRLDARTLWRWAQDCGATPTQSGPTGTALVGLQACELCGFVHAPDRLHAAATARCQRCGSGLHPRKPDSLARTWAYLVTAFLLYIPANLLPIMRTSSVFEVSEHTILGGVVELWRGGAPDIALVVFVASIAVPLLKFGVLILLLLAARRAQQGRLLPSAGPGQRKALRDQQVRAQLYRFIEFIGQWSMLDVFVVLVLAALVNFQGLMQVTAGLGAIAFGLTVSLTMLAAMSFDPRLIWDGYVHHDMTSHAGPLPSEPGELHA
jgi:paraquat-inducible protein A